MAPKFVIGLVAVMGLMVVGCTEEAEATNYGGGTFSIVQPQQQYVVQQQYVPVQQVQRVVVRQQYVPVQQFVVQQSYHHPVQQVQRVVVRQQASHHPVQQVVVRQPSQRQRTVVRERSRSSFFGR